jgi:glycosyltransferase involved in cell wall biosynthesis
MKTSASSTVRVYLDLTHVGRHVTGIERVAIEQFEKVAFEGADLRPVRAQSVAAMILKQQIVLPLLALIHPHARFIFPGFPPSPFFTLIANRVTLYVHDLFLLTRHADLKMKARLYMAPQFRLAVRMLKHFFVNSEKTAAELKPLVRSDAEVRLYRPGIANHFALEASAHAGKPARPSPLKLVSLGTIEPRKNYNAAIAILDAIRSRVDAAAELHIIGRAGWGDANAAIAKHPGVIVHGYLPSEGVKSVLEAADIYLCTSHDEGLGLPLLEAQFAGLPVLAPDKPVFHEALADSGVFIDTERPDAAARMVLSLITQPDWRRHHARLATGNIQRWNAIAKHDLADARSVFVDRPRTEPRLHKAAVARHA